MNEDLEALKGRLAVMRACVWAIMATLSKQQTREIAALLPPMSESLAAPLSDAARAALKSETSDVLKLLNLA